MMGEGDNVIVAGTDATILTLLLSWSPIISTLATYQCQVGLQPNLAVLGYEPFEHQLVDVNMTLTRLLNTEHIKSKIFIENVDNAELYTPFLLHENRTILLVSVLTSSTDTTTRVFGVIVPSVISN